MPIYHRIYSPGDLQFITASTYRRSPVFLSDRFRRYFVERLEEARRELHFLLLGWVLIPEHFHMLISPERSLRDRRLPESGVCASRREWMPSAPTGLDLAPAALPPDVQQKMWDTLSPIGL